MSSLIPSTNSPTFLPPSSFNLRSLQKSLLTPFLTSKAFHILITSPRCHFLLTHLFTPAQLRTLNITLHHQLTPTTITTPPNIPITYILEDTSTDLQNLLQHLQKRPKQPTTKRDQQNPDKHPAPIKIAFLSSLSNKSLTLLTNSIPLPTNITEIVDLHCDFLALEQNLFQLGHLPTNFERLIHSLSSLFLTLNVIPVIRAQTGSTMTNRVAKALTQQLRQSLDLFLKPTSTKAAMRGERSSSSVTGGFRKCLLLLMDRRFDWQVMLHHCWGYQSLCHDCLGMEWNCISALDDGDNNKNKGSGKDGEEGGKVVLDKEEDEFWRENCDKPFPVVAENIEKELQDYRGRLEEINQQSHQNGDRGDGGKGDGGKGGEGRKNDSEKTKLIEKALMSLPELTHRKHLIDVHTNIATRLLDIIKTRGLDAFYELEDQIIYESSIHDPSYYENAVLDLIKGNPFTSDGSKRGIGTANDRLRLFLIFYLHFGNMITKEQMDTYLKALNNVSCDTKVVKVIQELKQFHHEDSRNEGDGLPGKGSVGRKRAMIKGMMTSVVSRGYRGIRSVAQNATQLVSTRSKSYKTTKIVSYFVSEQARNSNVEESELVLDGYKFYYPKMDPEEEKDKGDVRVKELKRMVFDEAVVFMMGGGSYTEFQNIEECLCRGKENPPKIIYGATQMTAPEEFLDQVTSLETE